MFGIGLPELILIMAIALIVVGPDKLPDLAKTIARQLLELKKAAGNLKDSLEEEMKQDSPAAEDEPVKKMAAAPAAPGPETAGKPDAASGAAAQGSSRISQPHEPPPAGGQLE